MGEGRSLRALLNQYRYLRAQSVNESLTERAPTTVWGTIAKWSKMYGWVERSKKWDQEVWIQDEQDHLRFWRHYRDRIQKVGDKMLAHAEEMLKMPLIRSQSSDGTTIIEPAKWQLADATKFTSESLKLVQTAIGPATLQGLEIKQAKALDLHVEAKQLKELEAIAVLAQSGMASDQQLEILTSGITEIQERLRDYNDGIVESEVVNAEAP